MRRAADGSTGAKASGNKNDNSPNNDTTENGSRSFFKNPKERVDSDALAQAALDKARYSMELRQFLEANKTDQQRYEEMRKKLDKQTEQLEDNLEKVFDSKNAKQ
jgi:hypothetical protein